MNDSACILGIHEQYKIREKLALFTFSSHYSA